MQYAIMTDLEGPAGVERFSQTRNYEPFYVVSMRQLTKEVNAAVAGIFDADAEAVVHVVDGHGSGGIIKEEMDQRALYIRRDQPINIYEHWHTYHAFMYVGQHAMACTPNAPLAHTGSSKHIVYKRINGVCVGEFGIGAAKAGYHGVPTIFLSGDDKACAEASTLIAGIFTVATKWGKGWQKARHLSSDEACRRIRQTIAEACRSLTGPVAQRIKPLRFDPPYSYEVRYIRPTKAPQRPLPGVRVDQLDAYTVLYRADDLDLLPLI
ncbi:MAG TPA: M55 family metallopeptidase [Firmicutes bacterium]|nr:M55 family metallopeptidase [Bacillota bacterium]